jgi:hypothetical protein
MVRSLRACSRDRGGQSSAIGGATPRSAESYAKGAAACPAGDAPLAPASRSQIGHLTIAARRANNAPSGLTRSGSSQPGDEPMTWETPAFEELKMDAEINSYQDDFPPDRDDSL